MDMICYMHEGTPYGHLKVNLKVILPSNLATMSGATLQETEGWLYELEQAGVFSRDENGCIFSRRMIRDETIRESRAKGGILGGNPALKDKGKVANKVNLSPNLHPTPSSSSSFSSSNNKEIEKSPKNLTIDELVNDGLDSETAKEWLAHRKNRKAPMTPRAWQGIMREIKKSGMTPESAISMALSKGWQGFDCEWVKGQSTQKPTTKTCADFGRL